MSFHPAMPYGTTQWHRSQRVTLPEGPEFAFAPATRARFEEFAAHYAPEHRKSAVLAALYLGAAAAGALIARARWRERPKFLDVTLEELRKDRERAGAAP